MTRFVTLLAALGLIAAACAGGGASPSSLSSPTTTRTPAPSAPPTPTSTVEPGPSAGPSWKRLSAGGDVPAPREDHTWTVDAAADTAWLFGGRDRGTLFNDLWAYDLASNQWTRAQPLGDVPAARFGHTGTWVDGVGLVVWSGQSGGDFFADLRAYDPSTNRWTLLPDAGAVPEARYGSCAAIGPDSRLWISHGFTHTGRFADTRAYDFDLGEWTDKTPAGATAPVKRCLHDCVWSPDGRLVLYAGQTDGVAALGDLWTLDPAGAWTEAAAPEPAARQLYALAASGGMAWVFGGRGADGKPLGDLWTLDLATLEWLSAEPGGDAPAGRAGATLVADAARSRLLVFGGVGATAFGDTWQLTLP